MENSICFDCGQPNVKHGDKIGHNCTGTKKPIAKPQPKLKCSTCKFFAQGKTCSYCANPRQENVLYQEYTYYNFGCDQHEPGTHETRIAYMEKVEQKQQAEEVKSFWNTIKKVFTNGKAKP